MFLMISDKPRRKNRSKTNRLKAARRSKNRRRVQRMRSKPIGRKNSRKW